MATKLKKFVVPFQLAVNAYNKGLPKKDQIKISWGGWNPDHCAHLKSEEAQEAATLEVGGMPILAEFFAASKPSVSGRVRLAATFEPPAALPSDAGTLAKFLDVGNTIVLSVEEGLFFYAVTVVVYLDGLNAKVLRSAIGDLAASVAAAGRLLIELDKPKGRRKAS